MNIAFVPKAFNNPVFRLALEGASQAARDLSGEASGFEVKVSCMSPAELNEEQQAAAVKKALASQPNGLVLSCLGGEELDSLIGNAEEQGIRVVTFDSDCPFSGRTSFYGVDNSLMGEHAADLLLGAMFPTGERGPKRIAILSGNSLAKNLREREDGFRHQLMTQQANVQVEMTKNCNETAQDCGKEIESIIAESRAKNSPLDGLFVTGLWGLQSACTCDENGLGCSCDDHSLMPEWKAAANPATGKLKTVSYDTLPFELMLMEKGYISALISQNYFSWGYESVELVFRHLTERPVRNVVKAESVLVDSEAELSNTLSTWEALHAGSPPPSVCETP